MSDEEKCGVYYGHEGAICHRHQGHPLIFDDGIGHSPWPDSPSYRHWGEAEAARRASIPETPRPMHEPLLTDLEMETVQQLGLIWNSLCDIVGDGASRDSDLNEAMFHIHGLQRFITSNAAARVYSKQLRLLGGTIEGES